MSLRINCPHCGIRPLEEFYFGEILAPPEALTEPDDIALDRAFMHNNTEGVVREAWFHTYGCRRWLTIYRDTTTNLITSEP